MYKRHMLSLLSPSQKQHGNLIRQPYFLNFDIDNGYLQYFYLVRIKYLGKCNGYFDIENKAVVIHNWTSTSECHVHKLAQKTLQVKCGRFSILTDDLYSSGSCIGVSINMDTGW